MANNPIELILLKQLASYLRTPVFVIDVRGTLIYFNEGAEELMGLRFEDTAEMPRDEWLAAFAPRDIAGAPLPNEANPLLVALAERREVHQGLSITGLDRRTRRIEVTAFPIEGQDSRLAGAVAIFWEAAR